MTEANFNSTVLQLLTQAIFFFILGTLFIEAMAHVGILPFFIRINTSILLHWPSHYYMSLF